MRFRAGRLSSSSPLNNAPSSSAPSPSLRSLPRRFLRGSASVSLTPPPSVRGRRAFFGFFVCSFSSSLSRCSSVHLKASWRASLRSSVSFSASMRSFSWRSRCGAVNYQADIIGRPLSVPQSDLASLSLLAASVELPRVLPASRSRTASGWQDGRRTDARRSRHTSVADPQCRCCTEAGSICRPLTTGTTCSNHWYPAVLEHWCELTFGHVALALSLVAAL